MILIKAESRFEFGWKVVVMGYGCGFLIGVVILIGQHQGMVIDHKYNWFIWTLQFNTKWEDEWLRDDPDIKFKQVRCYPNR